MKVCKHNKRPSRCVDCGGSATCTHKKVKIFCGDCSGSQICVHKKYRSGCKECGGGAICKHKIHRAWCFKCSPLSFARNRLSLFKTQAKRKGYTCPDITPEGFLFLMKISTHCVGCGGLLNWKTKQTPHLHHNHKTGYVFGFCHPLCNQVEGMLSVLSVNERKHFINAFFPEVFK